MWRLFMRNLLLLSLLQYAAKAEKVAECPANKVCAIFVKDFCNVNGVRAVQQDYAGWLYEDATSCARQEYDDNHYARLDIEPLSLHSWALTMIFWDRRANDQWQSEDQPHLENIGFDFGSARITFPTKTGALFEWHKTDDAEWQNSSHALKFEREFDAVRNHFTFMEYSFTITSDEKLPSLLGKQSFSFLRMIGTPHNASMVLDDPRFIERLSRLSPCDSDELSKMSVCHGGCEKLQASNDTAEVVCASNATVWFHNTNDALFTRHWLAADEIKCWLGSYKAIWKGGFQVLEPTMEVQCALEQPAKWMALGICMMVGTGLIVVIILVLIAYFLWRCKKKRDDAKSHSDAPTFSTPSTPGLYRSPSIQSKRFVVEPNASVAIP